MSVRVLILSLLLVCEVYWLGDPLSNPRYFYNPLYVSIGMGMLYRSYYFMIDPFTHISHFRFQMRTRCLQPKFSSSEALIKALVSLSSNYCWTFISVDIISYFNSYKTMHLYLVATNFISHITVHWSLFIPQGINLIYIADHLIEVNIKIF